MMQTFTAVNQAQAPSHFRYCAAAVNKYHAIHRFILGLENVHGNDACSKQVSAWLDLIPERGEEADNMITDGADDSEHAKETEMELCKDLDSSKRVATVPTKAQVMLNTRETVSAPLVQRPKASSFMSTTVFCSAFKDQARLYPLPSTISESG